MRKTEFVHGVLVRVWDKGVLILGESRSGKSLCALELIHRGHALIADDVIAVEFEEDRLVGSAPERFAGLLEIRGLGIVDVRELFGPGSYAASCAIDLCIVLADTERGRKSSLWLEDKLPFDGIPTFTLLASRGTCLPVLIDTAVRLVCSGQSPNKIFAQHDVLLAEASV